MMADRDENEIIVKQIERKKIMWCTSFRLRQTGGRAQQQPLSARSIHNLKLKLSSSNNCVNVAHSVYVLFSRFH